MINVKEFLSLIFCEVSAQDILDPKSIIKYNELENEIIYKLMERKFHSYNRNELRNLLCFFKDECTDMQRRYRGTRYEGQYASEMDVFSLLFYYTTDILVIQDNEICCQYNRFLQWRMLTLEVGEDMLITAFLADWDCRKRIVRRNFNWPIAIGHNNNELNMIMRQGLAENHFHLKGSAPAFHIAWVHLMNDFSGSDREKVLSIDKTRRRVSYRVSDQQKECSLYEKTVQAAAIRMYLFSKLTGIDVILEDAKCETEQIGDGKKQKSGGKKEKLQEAKQKKERLNKLRRFVEDLLVNPEKLTFNESKIYHGINSLRSLYIMQGIEPAADYAMYDKRIMELSSKIQFNKKDTTLKLLWGERSFLYNMFRAICEGGRLSEWDKNIFYAYLVIRENVRAEFLQKRDYVGFENFSIFEQRKGLFSSGDRLVQLAMHDTLLSPNIRYLEARICPWDTAEDNVQLIKRMDALIDPEEKHRQRYCYIMHFVKEEDKDPSGNAGSFREDGCCEVLTCRHEQLRMKLEQQANALIKMREYYPAYAKRILGIDACNQEIGCRPEVFGSVFRQLVHHTAYEDTSESIRSIPQLRITYHAGEDFLDVADGLRAIDEAISFLEMRCGDRLGHALALGVDVEEWYNSKNIIILPMQDYLDNIVWVYFSMSIYNIPDTENLKAHLEEEFEFYFQRIYRRNIHKDVLDGIQEAASKYYTDRRQSNYYDCAMLQFDINSYRKSCMLRGDDPIYYRDGFFKNVNYASYVIQGHKINKKFPEDYNIRYTPEAAILNYYYQYDPDVKRAGAMRIKKKMHPAYIHAVKQIQKQLQKNIAIRGISIEANPTSNYLIGTFKRYDKHPIISWYNKSLEMSTDKIQESPQLSVSINTDDQGVFSTKLENEFSLMALALERYRDGDNKTVYNKTIVYQWLDDIRRFGIRQNFMSKYATNYTEELEEINTENGRRKR